jgi:hypothetical protein
MSCTELFTKLGTGVSEKYTPALLSQTARLRKNGHKNVPPGNQSLKTIDFLYFEN